MYIVDSYLKKLKKVSEKVRNNVIGTILKESLYALRNLKEDAPQYLLELAVTDYLLHKNKKGLTVPALIQKLVYTAEEAYSILPISDLNVKSFKFYYSWDIEEVLEGVGSVINLCCQVRRPSGILAIGNMLSAVIKYVEDQHLKNELRIFREELSICTAVHTAVSGEWAVQFVCFNYIPYLSHIAESLIGRILTLLEEKSRKEIVHRHSMDTPLFLAIINCCLREKKVSELIRDPVLSYFIRHLLFRNNILETVLENKNRFEENATFLRDLVAFRILISYREHFNIKNPADAYKLIEPSLVKAVLKEVLR